VGQVLKHDPAPVASDLNRSCGERTPYGPGPLWTGRAGRYSALGSRITPSSRNSNSPRLRERTLKEASVASVADERTLVEAAANGPLERCLPT
jgi:hypothetical protein